MSSTGRYIQRTLRARHRGLTFKIGFYGSNPGDPYDLGAEMEVTIDGETHNITRTSMIFLPSGMPHMPLRIKKVDRPVFHFSIVLNPEYTGDGAYK